MATTAKNSNKTEAMKNNWPLPDISQTELMSMSLRELTHIIEIRGLNASQAKQVNQRRQILRNRVYAENRRTQSFRAFENAQLEVDSKPPLCYDLAKKSTD